MNKILHCLILVASVAAAVQLTGCASSKAAPNTIYDFGPARAAVTAAAPSGLRQSLVVTDVTGSSAYDSERIYYRFSYADPLQARSYANSRWSTTPLQMLTQRFKTRIAQAGAKVLSTTDASTGVAILRIDVDDFIHTFTGVAQSEGEISVRASVFQGRILVDQKSFRRTSSAATADAAGGAAALAASTDAVAADIVAWLAAMPPR